MKKTTDESHDGPDDISSLREEIARLREEVRHISESTSSQSTRAQAVPGKPDLARSLSEYVNDVVESVMSGISSEVERTAYIGSRGAWFDRHATRMHGRSMTAHEAEKAAGLMGAMASEHRLRILGELLYGGRYASEIESVLKDISPSTISSHLKTLQEASLVVQEGDRGRYLITLPGRIALRMATRLSRFLEHRRP